MKNHILALCLAIILPMAGCKKSNIQPASMENDADVMKYLENTKNIILKIQGEAEKRGSINLLPTARLTDLPNLIGKSATNDLMDWSIEADRLMLLIKERYGQMDEEEIKRIAMRVAMPEGLSTEGGCERAYYLCMGAAMATAMGCHAGCVGATIGLGAPACVAICVTIQVYQSYQCAKEYCDYDKLKHNDKN